jgi:hypothetical protein
MEAFLIFLFFLAVSWGSLAAYLGMATYVASLPGIRRQGIYVFTSCAILIPSFIFLLDQDSYTWLDAFTYQDIMPDRNFCTGFFGVNVCFFEGIALSFTSARYLAMPLRIYVRRICILALLPAMLCTVANIPRGLFLPLAFVPNGEFIISRLILLAFMLVVGTLTFVLLDKGGAKD